MLSFDPTLLCASLFIIASVIPVSTPGTPSVGQSIEIPFGKPILVNAIVSSEEWTNAGRVGIELGPGWTVHVLFKHDARNLYVAFLNLTHGSSERYPEVLIDSRHKRSHSWQRGQWWLHASYNLCDGDGEYGTYYRSGVFQCSQERQGWAANLFPLQDDGAIEFKISLSNFIMKPGTVIGIAFVVTDTQKRWNLWPRGAKPGEPNTWGEALINAGH